MKNHVKITQEALSGKRPSDEQLLESVAILSERLERIRSFGGKFAQIGFSSAALKLTVPHKAMAI